MDDKLAETSLIYSPLDIIKRSFRAQPIICAQSHAIKAMEILCKRKMSYSDRSGMLAVDRSAVEAASIVSDYWRVAFGESVRIHCNVELSSFLSAEWLESIATHVNDDLVVEIVERHDDIRESIAFDKMCVIASYVRMMGAKIALDDIAGTEMDALIIRAVKPEFVKVCSKDGLAFVRDIGHESISIAEMIETEAHAQSAIAMGVDELQGYWCDVVKEREFPQELSPPGVQAKYR
jgi:EAL domain-containing protein (putative c-di-GMP-specific phosphodiesterase class I)